MRYRITFSRGGMVQEIVTGVFNKIQARHLLYSARKGTIRLLEWSRSKEQPHVAGVRFAKSRPDSIGG